MTPYLEIVGKDLSGAQKEGVKTILRKIESENLKSIEGERPKTKLEIAFIDHAIAYVREYLRKLGLSDQIELTREHFHIMSEGGYTKKFHSLSEGLYDDQTFSIYIDYFEIFVVHPIFLFEVILHEVLHAMAFHLVDVTEYDDERASVKMKTLRSGYNSFDFKKGEPTVSFYGFDEMIDDAMVTEILIAHTEEIKQMAPEDDWYKLRNAESHPFVKNVIAQKIADGIHRPFDEIWKIFMKGYFDGSAAALDLVKNLFGEQALHLLSIFKDKTDFAEDDICYPALQSFFTSNDAVERKSAACLIESRCSTLPPLHDDNL